MRPFSTSCFDEFGKKKTQYQTNKNKTISKSVPHVQHDPACFSLSNHVIDICDEVIAVDVS